MSRMCIPWLVIYINASLGCDREYGLEKQRPEIKSWLCCLQLCGFGWVTQPLRTSGSLVVDAQFLGIVGGAGEYTVHPQGRGSWRPHAHERQQYSVGWERVGSMGTGKRNCSPTCSVLSHSKRSLYLPLSSNFRRPQETKRCLPCFTG